MKRKFIEVYNIATDEVIRRLDVSHKTERYIETVVNGMEINMNPFYATRVVTKETET